MDLVYSYIAFAIAYLIGSIPFAVVFSKVFRLPDPRTFGSKNPGATNVLRSGNKAAAVLTLVFDALKGYAPTAAVQYYAFDLGFEDTTVVFVGVSAFLGHLFPVFLRFRGGKGVATAAGVLLALEPLLGLGTLVAWIAVAAVFRYSSLASLMAAAFAPFFAMLFFDRTMLSLGAAVMSLLLIWRHWSNIVKLVKGQESKLGQKADDDNPKKRRRRRAHRLHEDAAGSAPSHRSKGN